MSCESVYGSRDLGNLLCLVCLDAASVLALHHAQVSTFFAVQLLAVSCLDC